MEFQGPFDKNARRALAASVHRAGMLGRETVGTEHLLLGLSASAGGTASKLLADAGAGGWRSLYYTARLTGSRFPMRRPRCISPELRLVLHQAASAAGGGQADERHLLCALVRFRGCMAHRVLEHMRADIPALERQTGMSLTQELHARRAYARPAATATLDRYATDLTELARAGRLDPGHRQRKRAVSPHDHFTAPHEKQSGAAGRSRCRKDCRGGGTGTGDCRRQSAGRAAACAAGVPWIWRA